MESKKEVDFEFENLFDDDDTQDFPSRGSPRRKQSEFEYGNDVRRSPKSKKRSKYLESLPSPRAMHIKNEFEFASSLEIAKDDDPPQKFISISELNPFFEELDLSMTDSSAVEDSFPMGKQQANSTENLPVPRTLVKKKRALIKRDFDKEMCQICIEKVIIPSMLAANKAKSQESVTSFSSSNTDSASSMTDEPYKKISMRKKLSNMSDKIRRQLSSTGGLIAEKLTRQHKKENGTAENATLSESTRASTQPKRLYADSHNSSSSSFVVLIDAHTNDTNRTDALLDPINQQNYNRKQSRIMTNSLVWSLPNWVDSEIFGKSTIINLEEVMDAEKRRMAQKQPIEWAEAMGYLKRSVGRDFRRGYLVLGEKVQLPNTQAVKCMKFNPNCSILGVGCDKGKLLVLQLNYQKQLHHHHNTSVKSSQSLQSLLYSMPVGSECQIQMNANLVGHSYDLCCLDWNGFTGKLISSDDIGVIIGWGYTEKGCWQEEIINDRSTSIIRNVVWSPDGKKIGIGYEDCSEAGIVAGVLVGYADGNRIFCRQFSDSRLNCVVWYNEDVIWAVINSVLYSFDGTGELWKTPRPLSRNADEAELTSLLLKPRTSWVTFEGAPEFAVVFKDSCMTLFNSIEDKSPVRIHTKLVASCADLCQNGLYIAVGGMSVSSCGEKSTPRINLYNYEGNLLQIVKIPGKSVSSISWDSDSLHLAVSTRRNIYFANLRPMYKVTSSGNVHCYAYTTNLANQCIVFWNEKVQFTENIPGKVIDIKCCNKKFSLLCMDNMGVYHVFIFNENGLHEHHLCVTTMEPFAITMTKGSVTCLAPNAILNWNFNQMGQGQKFTGALKKTRQVHIDDYPAIIAKPGERSNHLMRPAINCARCMSAVRDQLCIARESGKLQLYALPTLGFLQAYQLDLSDGDICHKLNFNSDGTRIALLTMNGLLKIFLFPEASGQGTQLVDCVGLTFVSDFVWASDMTNVLCVLEGAKIHIVKDCEQVEVVSKIPSGSYLAKFDDLVMTVIDMEQIIENPDNPLPQMVLKLQTPTLAKVESQLANCEPFKEIVALLDNACYNHPLLRKVIAEEALRQGEYTVAEYLSIYDKNYAAIKLLEKIREWESPELKKAEVCCFLGDYERAQHFYFRADRKELALKMWSDLGNWERMDFLSGTFSGEIDIEMVDILYDECVECKDWESAYDIALKAGNAGKVMECSILLEDHDRLVDLAERLPPGDPLLKNIGSILACDGLTEKAVKCFAEYGDFAVAMNVAVETRHWDLAMRLSHQYHLPVITPSLAAHVKSLIASNNLNSAIQILERCGKIITVGKLLVWKGLSMLQDPSANTMQIKKIFVLAAQTLSKRNTRTKNSFKNSLPNPTLTESQDLDIEFLIPAEQLRIMNEHNGWCWSDPWRGAEAVHFLNLAQRFIYCNMSDRAFKAAMHLKSFVDIIGTERLYSLMALTGINEGCFSVASNALLKLEAIDEAYSPISYAIFKEQPPQDKNIRKISCPGCKKLLPDFQFTCKYCNTKLFICVVSACPIVEESEMWTCDVCSRHIMDSKKRDRYDYCFLCHNKSK